VLTIGAAGRCWSRRRLALRAANPGVAGRALQGGITLLALAAAAYAAVYRADLINMVLETFRAGPE